jgi:retron-type reverse transcriptase
MIDKKMMLYIVIKHSADRRKLISKGNIACTKRRSEKASAKLLVNMGRFTNPNYNFLAGSEVPFKCLSVRNYVVFLSPNGFNKPATSSSFRKGSPKLTLRRKRTEFAMTRNSKEWGLRRVHSTATSSRKGLSYVKFDKDMLSGVYESNQLNLLRSYIISNKKCNNLSIIMSDPNFLLSAWVRVRSNNGSLTPAMNSDTLDDIDLAWFQKTANIMRNGIFQFSPYKRTYISRPDGKKQSLTIPSPKDKIVQEAMRFLLMLVFENDFSKNSHGWVTGRGCHAALNQIKMQFAQDNWFIEGDIDPQFPSINHQVLVNLLKTKIADQAFIDLIYKYLKVSYGESSKNITRMSFGTSQGGVLSPILASILMTPFDKWVESHLIPKYTNKKES